MAQDHRVVRRHRAERVVGGQPLDVAGRRPVPLLLVPAAPADQRARRRVFHGVGHHRDDLVPIGHVHQVELHPGVADAQEVPVAFDEARDSQLPFEIDHFGAGTDVAADLIIAADGEYRIAQDRDRLPVGHRLVDGDDHPVPQHQVGGDLLPTGATHHQGDRADENAPDQRTTL